MVKLINAMTGTEMWVEDSRVEEYLKLGHKKPKEGKGKAKAEKDKPLPEANSPEGKQPQEADAPESEPGE